jgi:hypothetical protein
VVAGRWAKSPFRPVLSRLAPSVLVQASFIYQNCATAVNIATDVSVPLPPGASHRRLSMNKFDLRGAFAGPRRWVFSTVSRDDSRRLARPGDKALSIEQRMDSKSRVGGLAG